MPPPRRATGINLMARSLRKQAAHAVLVLVPNLDNQFYPEIIRGIESAAHARDYTVMLGFTDNDASRETSYVDLVRGSAPTASSFSMEACAT